MVRVRVRLEEPAGGGATHRHWSTPTASSEQSSTFRRRGGAQPAYRHPNPAEGRKIATRILDSFSTCPVPDIARLGRTLKRWKDAFLAYFDTGRSNNGGTEAVNGHIKLHRRVARGFATTTTTAYACSSSMAAYATPT